jgi:hypothetical protein
LRALQSRISEFHGVLLDNEQLREAMRQIEYLVEDQFKPSDSEDPNYEERIRSALRTSGLDFGNSADPTGH